ncbi:MAG: hypothetical protein Q9209_000612 [Squamulea sp. 1 TL-2023]
MATSNPNITFVIVPGAWHPSSIYGDFVSHLQEAGYGATVATYPSCDSQSPKTTTCEEDSKAVRQHCMSLIEKESKELVLVCHSYGGIPAAGAAFGLSKENRLQEGKNGGVIGLVYMAAFVVPEGSSLLMFLGGKHAPYVVPDTPSEGMATASPAVETFFNDIDKDTAARLAATLVPHAMLAFDSQASPPAWAEPAYEGRRAFVRCLQDQALPTFIQDMFVQKSGVGWHVKDIDAGHSAYVSRLKEVSEAITGFAEKFEASYLREGTSAA